MIGSLSIQAPTAGVVPVVHAIAGGQEVAPGVVFVGRHKETERLLDALAPDGSGPVVVSAVSGMGGIGKTALARFCAAKAVERGWFPGGAYVVDLQGYSPNGMVSNSSLFAPLLQQFGVPAENVPAEPAAQAAMYDQALRTMAAQGHQVLLVLDNASTAAQVDGLLPTTGGHRVVVTTRDTLAVPGARRLDLDVLTETDALALLADLATNMQGATDLVQVCGFLPLAIRIAAGLLADEPDTTCAELATELADTPTEGFAHGETRVAPVLAASIDLLAVRDPRAAQLLRLLPLNPGPDISTEAAAALGGLSISAARTSLRALRHAHLITLVDRRWRLHDLVRRHLLDNLKDSDASTTRLLDYYTATADAADDHLDALPGEPVPDMFTGRDHALEWFDAEHANLVSAVQLAADTNHTAQTIRLAVALGDYQLWRLHLNDWLTVSRTALDVCQKSGNQFYIGIAWNNLGMALAELLSFDEAVSAYERATGIFQEIGDREREADASNNLGLALRELGPPNKAVIAHKHARDIYKEVGDRRGEASAWNNMGLALEALRQFDEAVTAYERAIATFQEIGDRNGEGNAWNGVGMALWQRGRLIETVAAYEHARDIHQETGDRRREGLAWGGLGLALWGLQRLDEVRRCLVEATAAVNESGDTDFAQTIERLLELFDAIQKSKGS